MVMTLDIIYYTSNHQLLGHCISKPGGGTVHPNASTHPTYNVVGFVCKLQVGVVVRARG